MAGAEGEEAAETPAESRASSQHEGEVRQLEGLESGQFVTFFLSSDALVHADIIVFTT